MTQKIGIISKEAHAKPHKKMLEEEGYSVELLGATPLAVPPSLDALVVRVTSSSHLGTDVANVVRRKGHVPVIFEDSVTRIRERVHDLFRPGWRETEVAVLNAKTEMSDAVCGVMLINVITACRCFTPLFFKGHKLEQIVDVCQAAQLIEGHKEKVQALDALQLLSVCPPALLKKVYAAMVVTLTELKDPTGFKACYMYFNPKDQERQKTRRRHTIIAAEEVSDYQLETLASFLDCTYGETQTMKQKDTDMKQKDTDMKQKDTDMKQKDTDMKHDPLYYKPIHSIYFKAYYKRDSERWAIRGGDVAQRHIESHTTRKAVIERMHEMDELYAAQHDLPRPTSVVKQAISGRGVTTEYRILSVSVQEPCLHTQEFSSPAPPVAVPAEVSQDAPTQEGIEEAAYRDILLKLRQELLVKGLSSFGMAGLTIHVEHMHLSSPKGVACAIDTPHTTKDITKVSCSVCRTTDFYTAAAYALANLTIGD